MSSVTSWRLTKACSIKALLAALIALIARSSMVVTRSVANHTVIMQQQQKVELPVKKVDERLIAATSRFTFKLYNQVLKQDATKNVFVSPSSVMLALAMTYLGISHKSIFGTLLHMAGAEWIWLERWNGRSPAKDKAWLSWTTDSCADLAMLKGRWRDLIDRRTQFISELDEERLNAELAFKLLSGDPSSMRLVDQMQHVANHATLHRGQIVGMIRQLSIEPPSTDLLFYLRREISPK
jgi:uncharacterized damage-inducible protein DinB